MAKYSCHLPYIYALFLYITYMFMQKMISGLEDKVVLITGGTSGMGKATVMAAAAN